MTPAIELFRNRWEFVNGMTLAFASEIPDEVWDFSPHPRFATFRKQLRHVVCVRGTYNDAITTSRAEFARKHEHYTGGLEREELTEALLLKHEQLLSILAGLDEDAEIEFLGRQFPFVELAYVMVQHEAIHQGQWSLYASLAGLETPLMWRLNWGPVGAYSCSK
jgi:uncharacterized damage-inducible protein DinB